ncbi:multiheme c-type cytochrome [Chloroflexota bacterium]
MPKMKPPFGFRSYTGLLYIFAVISLCISGCQGSSNTVEEIELPEEKTGSPVGKTFVPLNIAAPDYCLESTGLDDAKGLSLTTFSTRNFAGSGQCAECHQNLVDNSGSDVSITSDWRSTMMANAAKDPLWQAKVSSEIARNPDLQAVIEGKCATCHMPMARTQAIASNAPVGIFDGAFLNPEDSLHTAAMDGVSCTLCHQIQDKSLGEHESFSGGYIIDTAVVSPDRLIYGPFPDPLQMQMRNRAGYIPVMGAQTKDSGLCATCHTLYTPYVNSQGEVVGEFPEQTPYLEWESSQYGDGTGDDKACQDCHMPVADGPVAISIMPRRLPAREPFVKHYFVGGNRFMLEIIKANSGELNLTAATSHLNTTIRRTKSQLSDNTASISLISAQKQGETLNLQVLVKNRAGHKLPTGFPSRRVWIHITVRDASGQMIFESGKPDSDGSISGNDADFDAAKFEPHYNTINSNEQVQIYEAIMRDTDERVTYTLLRAASNVKDNRMLPLGFDASNGTEDIAVYGNASEDDDFKGGEDKVNYLIPITNSEGYFEVTLAILYQPASYRFLYDLVNNDTNEIKRFSGFLDQACKMPEVISFAAYQIP